MNACELSYISNQECATPTWYTNLRTSRCRGREHWEWQKKNDMPSLTLWWEMDSSSDYIIEENEDMTTENGLGIHKAICALKLAIASGGGIQKGRSAPMGYKFRGIEDFDNILCGLSAEHGVAMYPRILSKEIIHGTTAKGGYQSHVIVEIEWSFYCATDGSHVKVSTVGEAMDTQDKSFNKAMQASRKYAILMVLMIPTAGDDTEIYVPEPAAVVAVTPPTQQPAPQSEPHPRGEAAKRTRGPNKPKTEQAPPQQEQALPRGELLPAEPPVVEAVVVDAEPFPPAQQAPQATGAASTAVARISQANTFAILYAFAQDADSAYAPGHPDHKLVFDAIKARAIALFAAAPNMSGVQEGFELVSALGQPDDLKQAANAAYGKFRK